MLALIELLGIEALQDCYELHIQLIGNLIVRIEVLCSLQDCLVVIVAFVDAHDHLTSFDVPLHLVEALALRCHLGLLALIRRLSQSLAHGLDVFLDPFLLYRIILDLLLLFEIQGGVPKIHEALDVLKVEVRRVLVLVKECILVRNASLW